jgi:deoxyribose-phosphate aldolase
MAVEDRRQKLAAAMEHTLLRADASWPDILRLCSEAVQWQFYAVCVNGCWVPQVKEFLTGIPVKIVTVAGFPLGASQTLVKCYEVEEAFRSGADEVDFVQNIGFLKERSLDKLRQEFRDLVSASGGRPLKVIIETALLDEEEKKLACQLACEAGISFVKTSTGFAGGGATIADIALIHKVVEGKAKVKASGGIRNAAYAWELLCAGADRLGVSAGAAIMQGELPPAAAY